MNVGHIGPNCVAGAYWLPLLSWNNLKTAYRLIFSYLERPSMLGVKVPSILIVEPR